MEAPPWGRPRGRRGCHLGIVLEANFASTWGQHVANLATTLEPAWPGLADCVKCRLATIASSKRLGNSSGPLWGIQVATFWEIESPAIGKINWSVFGNSSRPLLGIQVARYLESK